MKIDRQSTDAVYRVHVCHAHIYSLHTENNMYYIRYYLIPCLKRMHVRVCASVRPSVHRCICRIFSRYYYIHKTATQKRQWISRPTEKLIEYIMCIRLTAICFFNIFLRIFLKDVVSFAIIIRIHIMRGYEIGSVFFFFSMQSRKIIRNAEKLHISTIWRDHAGYLAVEYSYIQTIYLYDPWSKLVSAWTRRRGAKNESCTCR